jgi:hypothetical protein
MADVEGYRVTCLWVAEDAAGRGLGRPCATLP